MTEQRPFLRFQAIGLAMTLAGVVCATIAIAVLVLMGPAIAHLGLSQYGGRLVHAAGLAMLVDSVPAEVRAMLALFSYRRSHLHALGLAIASSCSEYDLVQAGGRVGMTLYALSREAPAALASPTSSRRTITLSTKPLSTLIPLDDEIDIGLRLGMFRDQRLVARMTTRVAFHVVGTPELVARVGKPASLADLAALPATGLIDRSTGRAWPWYFAQGEQFTPRSPAGFPDIASNWIDADALWKRVQAAEALSQRVALTNVQPLDLAAGVLGPHLDGETATAIKRAESTQVAFATLFASPAFQWRV